jgi:uncharacterized membrane protein YeaQ/YmgE (transglycosylase-associated protein family)
MATNRWLGGADAIAAAYYLVPGNVSIGNIFNVTINGKTVSYQTNLGTVADVIAGLVAALTASGVAPEFGEVTWTAPTTNTYLSAIAATPGVPVTITVSSAIGSGTTTPTFSISSTLSTPTNDTFTTSSTGGSLSNGTYYYRVTAITADGGETQASTETHLAITGGTSTQTVTVKWLQVPGASGYRIYGRSTGAEQYIAGVVGEATLSYTDTGSISPSGALPGSNTTAVASSGPNDWSTAANWSTGSVPANGDDVYVQNSAWGIYYGLAQSSVALNSLTIDLSMTGAIGLPEANPLGYTEYRPTFLAIGVNGTATIGRGSGSGTGRIKLDTGSANATTLNVYGTGNPAERGLESLLWRGNNSGNAVNIYKGSVGLGVYPGDTISMAGGFQVGYLTSPLGDAQVRAGASATFPSSILITGGTVDLGSSLASKTVAQTNGVVKLRTGAVATLTLKGGTFQVLATGTVITSACSIYGGGFLDLSQDTRAKTITPAITMYKGAQLAGDAAYVTYTAGFTTSGCGLSDVKVDCGVGRSYAVT